MDFNRTPNLLARSFSRNREAWYTHLREQAPVVPGRMSIMRCALVTRYAESRDLLTDPRFVRNRAMATGGSRFPVPIPKSVQPLVQSMIVADDPEHRRLRTLVHSAFTRHEAVAQEAMLRTWAEDLLATLPRDQPIDLQAAWANPIPVHAMARLLGIDDETMPAFQQALGVLSKGMTGFSILRTLLFDLRRVVAFVRDVITHKRLHPGPDLLSALIQAEADGERLSEDELLAMVFLLIVAGFETTVHLITNGVHTLLQHPGDLAALRADPTLLPDAIEELLRWCGPIQGTKPQYALHDLDFHGTAIAKGTPVFPLLAAANFDPRAWDQPDTFDIRRRPNHHLGFGHGIHFCLGAQLARMETRVALEVLLKGAPDMALAVPEDALQYQHLPLWQRLQGLPVVLGPA